MIHLRIMLLFIVLSSIAHARCAIYYHESPLTQQNDDAVAHLLDTASSCPQSIQSFQHLIQKNQLQIKTSMVANRGKNNPHLGSFSFFESINGTLLTGFHIKPGDLYLGYFTALAKDEIQLDQSSESKKLLIELIAWDNQKKLYNFYELRGLDSVKTRWYYRGDSNDALLDNQYLYRTPPANSAKFGRRMRCSACHNSGGPILKEIQSPHNDWWRYSNKLIFLPNHLDDEVNELVNELVDAHVFAEEVNDGIQQLSQSAPYQQFSHSLSLQEQLRPLFCTTEINIASNTTPGLDNPITIPSSFFLNPLLDQVNIVIPAHAYQNLLIQNRMRFPETSQIDADHAWLTPVNGINDIHAILHLIKDNRITQQFAQSVLMIDYQHPLFSQQRCDLLKQVPDKSDPNWVATFIAHLQAEKEIQPAAFVLATYLSNPQKYHPAYFHQILSKYKQSLHKKSNTSEGQQAIFQQLIDSRQAVFENELSKNPLGQILEPGFRVIFPKPLK